jgi:P-type Cu+ transporter
MSRVFNPSRLVAARQRMKLSKQELARRSALTAKTIGHYEVGEGPPSERTVDRLGKALGYPAEFFFGDDLELPTAHNASFRSFSRMSAAQRDAALAAGGFACARAKTVIFLAVEGRLAGLIAVQDPIKPGAKETLAALHVEGLRIVMLTGDNEATAQAVAGELGLDEVHASQSPEDKARWISNAQARGARVAMAGDGVNDAPALATADVGVAMGNGTDIAMESAQVTLVKGELTGILRARRLSRATVRNIHQNLAFAFLYNSLGVPIAAGALYPFFGWLLNPVIAAAAMSLSSVSVISNALRLRRVTL